MLRKKFYTVASQLFTEFCSHSTIHGISYLGGSSHQHRSLCERFWWLLMIILSMMGCGILIGNVYDKWQSSPVILSFDDRPTPVQQIPFPAVTICPESQYRVEAVDFVDKLMSADISEEEAEVMFVTLLTSGCDLMENVTKALDKLNFIFRKDIVDVWKKIYLSSPEYVNYRCDLNGNCGDKFKEIVTDQGICYSFNLLPDQEIFRKKNVHNSYLDWSSPTSDWSIDGGYHTTSNSRSYPHATQGSGYKAGMSLELRIPLKYTENLCDETEGYYVILHSPAEYPMIMQNYVYLKYSHEMRVTIRPEIITTSEKLWNYNPRKRQCLFSHERHLRDFVSYTQINCKIECYNNYTRENCGCVRFFMPRGEDVPVCEVEDIPGDCWSYSNYLNSNGFRDSCGCLPGCNSVDYSAEYVPTTYSAEASEEDLGKYRYSFMNIYFTQYQYMGLKRNELFGLTDLIANCGGVLGLCMGMSLLSLVELLYYCLMRPVMAMCCRRNDHAVHVLESVKVIR